MSILAGKTVLIVGGSSGIGLSTAIEARRSGANVWIASRSAERLSAAVEKIGSAEKLVVDIANEASVAQAMNRAGLVDHVVVTPGVVPPMPVRDKGAAIKAMGGFANKFWGAYHVAAHARIAESGSLTLISGVFATRPQKGMVMASCANAAIEALARGLALEFAPVRVNAISPGLIDTPLWHGMKPERKAAFFADAADKLPTRYIGQPADIAALAVACMTNPMLTGSILVADGGSVLT